MFILGKGDTSHLYGTEMEPGYPTYLWSGNHNKTISGVEWHKSMILAADHGKQHDLIGGALTDRVGWLWFFYINLPYDALAAASIVLFFKVPTAIKPTEASLMEKLLQMDILS
ncbi:hypothetical protein BJ875DRAFT_480693 [Amylocarpus encephaloides]|uniref:Uncharacterized protein n=1 Tax=Amylocarpus encephaloides TaxID=45428 RepID=A0A9P7YQK6_9HELO|nr:hypothetical protein BJ875DRAFT_480693 [Amylocarpus encephaloides]